MHLLAYTHNSVQNMFDILLRAMLLDVRSGHAVQFHPVTARIALYLFVFSSLYLFWGVRIAGIGVRIVGETEEID
jgi:hypothetical protein